MKQDRISLREYCMPLFDRVKDVQGEEACELPLSFGEALHEDFRTLEQRGRDAQIPSPLIHEVKYALAALVDESIMKSSWPGRSGWIAHSCQLTYFDEHVAGVHFFDRLQRLRHDVEQNFSVLEVYSLCLLLGFKGKYAITQEEELKALQLEIKHQLDHHREKPRRLNAVHAAPLTRNKRWSWQALSFKHIALCASLVLILIYSGFGLGFHSLHKAHQLNKSGVFQ